MVDDSTHQGFEESNTTGSVGRRGFLATLGAGVSAATVPAVSTAESKRTAQSAGISKAVRRLTARGRFEEASRLCERHGVEYGLSKGTMPALGTVHGEPAGSDENVSPDDGVSTEDAFKRADSYLYLYYWYEREDAQGQDIYAVECYADIAENDANVLDDANPLDGLALYWSDTYFQAVEVSRDNYVEVGADTAQQSYQDYKNYGVWAKFDDNYVQDNSIALDGNVERFTCGIRTEIEKLEYGNEFNVNAEYLHNWNFGGAYYVSGFSLGPVGLSFGGTNIDSWRREETVKI